MARRLQMVVLLGLVLMPSDRLLGRDCGVLDLKCQADEQSKGDVRRLNGDILQIERQRQLNRDAYNHHVTEYQYLIALLYGLEPALVQLQQDVLSLDACEMGTSVLRTQQGLSQWHRLYYTQYRDACVAQEHHVRDEIADFRDDGARLKTLSGDLGVTLPGSLVASIDSLATELTAAVSTIDSTANKLQAPGQPGSLPKPKDWKDLWPIETDFLRSLHGMKPLTPGDPAPTTTLPITPTR